MMKGMNMKKLILLLFILLGSRASQSQGLREWFAQRKTQREYLIEQIAHLKLYLELAEKGYKIAQEGLTMISSFKRGEFELHKNRFDSLMIVRSVIGSYGNVERITDLHDLVNMICERGGADLEKTNQFTSQELDYCKTVYARLYNDGQVIITHLLATIRNGQLSLTDDERIERIDELLSQVQSNYRFAKDFYESTLALARQKARERKTIKNSLLLHGLENLP
jgi:hypothetical protein